jgi:transcriptional antiterminator RfaH
MPTLPPEPDVYPPSLFDAAPAVEQARDWWVAHTRPRQEKCLARQLYAGGVPFYLPQVGRRNRVRGRIVTARVPLFPGYVFLLADRDERVAALATRRVARMIPVPDGDRLRHDLDQVRRLIDSGLPVLPEERLTPGMWVEVTRGPLAGLSGQIVRTAAGRKFVVRIDFIQRGASAVLDDCVLAPVDEPQPAA